MEHLLTEAEFWVGVALVLFVGLLVWVKAPGMAAKALDARAEKIRAELAEAERLRKEAEALLASIRIRREETERQAAEMLRNAEAEARRLEADAHERLEEQIKRRQDLGARRSAAVEPRRRAGLERDDPEETGASEAVRDARPTSDRRRRCCGHHAT